MTTHQRRPRPKEPLTIVPVYEPDPERQIEALRFLLQTRTRRAGELAAQKQVQLDGNGTREIEDGNSRG